MLFLALAALFAATSGAFARQPEIYTGLFSSLGAGGYDVVAYFTQKKPVEGSATFATEYKGATWRFVSAANRDAFVKNPTAYAPQYGGYCAWAVSQNYTAAGDPNVWKIVNGKLYLNYNTEVQTMWNAGLAKHIADGDRNWPSVLDK
ncbi:MAG: YHS domain-containing (seleno)protein [Rhizomicrobium sp.]